MPAHDLFDPDLPDPLFRTLAQLHGLAWQTKGERTPPATVLELAALRGLKERQMYNHLRELKARRRIRVENLGNGRIVIYPLRWEPGAALPTDARSTLTPADLAALADPSARLRTSSEAGRQGEGEHGGRGEREKGKMRLLQKIAVAVQKSAVMLLLEYLPQGRWMGNYSNNNLIMIIMIREARNWKVR